MEKKINIAEILKDCPSGMELDCIICNGVKFIELDRSPNFPIVVRANNGYEFSLTKYGQVLNIDEAKCVIFPKGKTTWEVPPCKFKDGDVVTDIEGAIFIYLEITPSGLCGSYVSLNRYNQFVTHYEVFPEDCIRLSTEEEKAKLFQAIKDNGYKWNEETKTLDKLPKFKVGDRIILKDNPFDIPSIKITAVTKSQYILENEGFFYISSADEKYVLEDKFNITTLKPFDKVLVRVCDTDKWIGDFYMWYSNTQKEFPYYCVNSVWSQCIPYEGNEYLCGKTDDCNDFYKNW